MTPLESMDKFLRSLGCKKRKNYYILDGFSSEFYLLFDADLPEDPNKAGTVDIHVCHPGSSPGESAERIRVLADCRRHQVMRFLFALGVERFNEETKKALYAANSIIREDKS